MSDDEGNAVADLERQVVAVQELADNVVAQLAIERARCGQLLLETATARQVVHQATKATDDVVETSVRLSRRMDTYWAALLEIVTLHGNAEAREIAEKALAAAGKIEVELA